MVRNMEEDAFLFGKQRNRVYATVSEASVMCRSSTQIGLTSHSGCGTRPWRGGTDQGNHCVGPRDPSRDRQRSECWLCVGGGQLTGCVMDLRPQCACRTSQTPATMGSRAKALVGRPPPRGRRQVKRECVLLATWGGRSSGSW